MSRKQNPINSTTKAQVNIKQKEEKSMFEDLFNERKQKKSKNNKKDEEKDEKDKEKEGFLLGKALNDKENACFEAKSKQNKKGNQKKNFIDDVNMNLDRIRKGLYVIPSTKTDKSDKTKLQNQVKSVGNKNIFPNSDVKDKRKSSISYKITGTSNKNMTLLTEPVISSGVREFNITKQRNKSNNKSENKNIIITTQIPPANINININNPFIFTSGTRIRAESTKSKQKLKNNIINTIGNLGNIGNISNIVSQASTHLSIQTTKNNKQSTGHKGIKQNLTEIRTFFEKDIKKKDASTKVEASNLLKNMNINNSNALDCLLEKNNKAIEKITNQNVCESQEETVYTSIDISLIESFYAVSYYKILEYLIGFYNKKGRYPDTDISFYKIGRQIGQGAFGKVNLGVHILSGRPVAIKSFKLNDKEISSVKRRLHLETQLMKTLNHQNVLKMYESFETNKYLMIVSEFIPGGDLLNFVRKRTKLNEPTAKYLFKQLLEGLKYIHSQGIIHRDVKLDNILLDANSIIKLCDFGVSKLIKQGDTMTEQCGTPAYIAPEIISGEGYTGFSADLWSSGVVLYSLLSGSLPFKANNMSDLQKMIMSSNYQELNEVSKEANNLISQLLEVDVKKRLSAEKALTHPFFRDVRKSLNIFSNMEIVPMRRFLLDYRLVNKDNLPDTFTYKNLETINEMTKENVLTKSNILGPNGTSMIEDKEKSVRTSIEILNSAIKYCNHAFESNRQYEIGKNGLAAQENLVQMKEMSFNLESSLYNESEEKKGNPFKVVSPWKEYNEYKECDEKEGNKYFNESVIGILEKMGFVHDQIVMSLKNNDCSYLTTCYYLLMKVYE